MKGPLEGYDVKHDLGLGADGIAVGRRRTDSANYANSSTVLLLLSYKQGKTLFKVVVSYYLDQINLDRARPPTTTMLESIRKWTSHKGHHYGQSERERKTKNTAKLEAKQLIFLDDSLRFGLRHSAQ